MDEKILNIVFFLLDPLNDIPKKYQSVVSNHINNATKKIVIGALLSYAVILGIYFWVSDYHKEDAKTWAVYRYVFAGCLVILAIILKLSKRSIAIKSTILLSSFTISSFFIYQASLGYTLREKWLTLPSTFILCLGFLPPLIGIPSLLLFTFLTKPLWIEYFNPQLIRSDLIFNSSLVAVSCIVWWFISKSKLKELEFLELKEKNIEQNLRFTDSIKTLISPILVKRLDEETSKGQSIHEALNNVMKLKYKPISVLTTDLRDYSKRSDDRNFIEKELIPSSSHILDLTEKNFGVGRLIGDSVMTYYDSEDFEESLLYSLRSAVKCLIYEFSRVQNLGREYQERHFILTFGNGFVGNMGSHSHKDATISGKPVNLGSRIDELTKHPIIAKILSESPTLVLGSSYAVEITKLAPLSLIEIHLNDLKTEIRSYPEESSIFLLKIDDRNLKILNKFFEINNLDKITIGLSNGK